MANSREKETYQERTKAEAATKRRLEAAGWWVGKNLRISDHAIERAREYGPLFFTEFNNYELGRLIAGAIYNPTKDIKYLEADEVEVCQVASPFYANGSLVGFAMICPDKDEPDIVVCKTILYPKAWQLFANNTPKSPQWYNNFRDSARIANPSTKTTESKTPKKSKKSNKREKAGTYYARFTRDAEIIGIDILGYPDVPPIETLILDGQLVNGLWSYGAEVDYNSARCTALADKTFTVTITRLIDSAPFVTRLINCNLVGTVLSIERVILCGPNAWDAAEPDWKMPSFADHNKIDS